MPPLLSPPISATSALIVVVLLMTICGGKPCPPTAVFLLSLKHNYDYCVCAPGLECVGDACDYGSDEYLIESPSFSATDVGFPINCTTCNCVNPNAPLTEATKPMSIEISADGTPYASYLDPHFQRVCKVSSHATNIPRPRALKNITWIHIPKCGTSLTSVIYHYVCQNTSVAPVFTSTKDEMAKNYFSRTCNYCYATCLSPTKCKGFTHWAPHDGLIRWTKSTFVAKQCTAQLYGVVNTHMYVLTHMLQDGINFAATFRNPLSRLRSAYNHRRHAFGMEDRRTMRSMTATWSLKQWASYPGIAHCQVKMVIGKHCASKIEITRTHLELAKKRVRENFAFIGLVEAWDASICLFHRQFGGSIHPNEYLNLRPAQAEVYGHEFKIATEADLHELTIADDPYDYELYIMVRQLFIDRLIKYGLAVPDKLLNPPDIWS